MSWLFSQALVEEYSQVKCSDGEQSVQLSVMPTPQQFWRNDKMMDCSIFSRFGLTYALLTEIRGEELLTLFLAGFHAKTSAQPAKAQESTESAADCGLNSLASFARYNLASSSWKTAQYSLVGDSERFSETWPKSGTMLNGVCWERKPLKLIIKEREYGLLPTPTARDWRACFAENSKAFLKRKESPAGVNLVEFCQRLMNGRYVKLRPVCVERLMIWPPGWTDLKPLATDKYHNVRQKHSDN